MQTRTSYFLERLFDETMTLLVEARNYLHANLHRDQQSAPDHTKLIYSTEISRITLRLSTAMSWILARRALHEGEISHAIVREQFPLQCREICDAQYPHLDFLLPRAICDLLQRTHALYGRIGRLDALESFTPELATA